MPSAAAGVRVTCTAPHPWSRPRPRPCVGTGGVTHDTLGKGEPRNSQQGRWCGARCGLSCRDKVVQSKSLEFRQNFCYWSLLCLDEPMQKNEVFLLDIVAGPAQWPPPCLTVSGWRWQDKYFPAGHHITWRITAAGAGAGNARPDQYL